MVDMDITKVLAHLPQRYPLLMVDRVLECEPGKRILALRTKGELAGANTVYYYAGIDDARFKRPVVPGDQLELDVQVLGHKRGIWKFACVARVAGVVVTEAEILCTERILESA